VPCPCAEYSSTVNASKLPPAEVVVGPRRHEIVTCGFATKTVVAAGTAVAERETASEGRARWPVACFAALETARASAWICA